MDMNPWERRQKILEVLCLRRHDTYINLAHEFNVSTAVRGCGYWQILRGRVHR